MKNNIIRLFYIIIEYLKKFIFLTLLGIGLTLLMINSGNEIVGIVIPLLVCEMIPRIYTLSEKRNDDIILKDKELKSGKEELTEDGAILIFLIIFISSLVGNLVYNNDFRNIVPSSLAFLTVFILFILSASYFSKKFYK